jgi:hypothetical protein
MTMLVPNMPLDKAVPLLASQLIQRAADVHDRGMHSAAISMRDAAALLKQLLMLHQGLCKRETMLTEERVRIDDIRAALNTEETGDALIEIARSAVRAEMKLAAIQREANS